MYSKAKPFLLQAVTSVHAGSGSEIGLVDLPVQRERHTGFPKIESSTLKGAIRYTAEQQLNKEERKHFELVFGSSANESKDNETQSSAIGFSDARVLLFPVKSMRGVFAWVTCPLVLKRFNDEMKLNRTEIDPLPVPPANTVSSKQIMVSNGNIVLEEFAFQVDVHAETEQLAAVLEGVLRQNLLTEIKNRVVVLSDDDFSDFVRLSTEVNARIKIDQETGTVQDGALWYEENVPPETVFYSLLYIGNVRGKGIEGMKTFRNVETYLLDETLFPQVFQLGGNSTLGRGMLRKIWM